MATAPQYALPNSPGRILTTAGAICVTCALVATAMFDLGAALFSGFGAFDLLGPIPESDAGLRAGVLFILLAYPALYAFSLLNEAWSFGGAAAGWLGRRVRGSLCLMWTTLLAGLLVARVVSGDPHAVVASLAAGILTVGGLAVRSVERQSRPSWKPLARMMPAALLSLVAVGIATASLAHGVRLGPLNGLLASSILVGTLLLLAGSTRDVLHQLRRGPRRFFSRERMQRALMVE